MEQLNTIKELINQGNVEQAILQLDEILQTDFPGKDEAYYLRGNAYRKQSNWQQALNKQTLDAPVTLYDILKGFVEENGTPGA